MTSVIVTEVAKAVTALALTFGFYLILNGHSSPGGAFQGGAVVASVLVLLVMAYGFGEAEKRLRGFSKLMNSAVFTSLAFLSVLLVFSYLLVFERFFGFPAMNTLSIMEVVSGVAITAGLAYIVLSLSQPAVRK
ncbi:MAG: MnhB domain-containing protein [Candidatus Diapherotrites archaeon]|nr:MnhB domain-containing protein [Candidatus Diapherotrites archaeon]